MSTLRSVPPLLLLATDFVGVPLDAEPSAADRRPNVMLIVADDLGFSDLGT